MTIDEKLKRLMDLSDRKKKLKGRISDLGEISTDVQNLAGEYIQVKYLHTDTVRMYVLTGISEDIRDAKNQISDIDFEINKMLV